MATQRRYSIEFKRQVVQEYQNGETLHGVAKRHGISRNLVRIWAVKAEKRASCRNAKRASARWSVWSASSLSRTSF